MDKPEDYFLIVGHIWAAVLIILIALYTINSLVLILFSGFILAYHFIIGLVILGLRMRKCLKKSKN